MYEQNPKKLDPFLSCPCEHTVNFEKCKIFAPKSAKSSSEEILPFTICMHWTSPWVWTSFMDSP